MRNYGIGGLFLKPTATYPKPIRLAVLKGMTMDIGGETDVLRGENLWAVDAAVKNGRCSGKIDTAQFDPDALKYIIPNLTKTTGTSQIVAEEAVTVPAPSGPYTVTVAQAATFTEDLGVFDTVTGLYMTPAATATGTGVYAVSAGGVYTFHSTDASKALKVSYRHAIAGSGSSHSPSNSLMGQATFLALKYKGSGFRVEMPKVVIPKLSIGLKSEGWTEYGMEYEAIADSTGRPFSMFFDE